jgi:hypothetical protein
MSLLAQVCTNCYEHDVHMHKQGFDYRNHEGIHYMAIFKPLCDACISTLEKRKEGKMEMFYLPGDRTYKFEQRRY